MVSEKLRKEMTRQHYKIIGEHSACKVCLWTRKALQNKGVCYKQLWYGIKSHRCLQMTPYMACDQKCVFCWRIIERTGITSKNWTEPSDIIEGCIQAQRKLLNGFPGYEGTDMRKFKEAQNPTNAAISLLGEPLLYPKISGLIDEFHKRNMSSFLVTNGQNPEALEKITEPTQLYVSVDAPSKELLKKIDRPAHQDYWERLNSSLEMLNSLSCRKVLRLTLVKGVNMHNPEGYAKLIEKANPDFVEAKAYMYVGESQKRLKIENMPSHDEVIEFSKQLSDASGFRVKDDFRPSRVVLLKS